MKIKAKIYDGEERPLQCSITKNAFMQSGGLEYFIDGETKQPVDPQVAKSFGFELADSIAPPSSIKSKSELSD